MVGTTSDRRGPASRGAPQTGFAPVGGSRCPTGRTAGLAALIRGPGRQRLGAGAPARRRSGSAARRGARHRRGHRARPRPPSVAITVRTWPTSRPRRRPTTAGTSRASRAPQAAATSIGAELIVPDGAGLRRPDADPEPARGGRRAVHLRAGQRLQHRGPQFAAEQQHPGDRRSTRPDRRRRPASWPTSRPTARTAATSPASSPRKTTKTGTRRHRRLRGRHELAQEGRRLRRRRAVRQPGHQDPLRADRPGRLRRRGRRQARHRDRHLRRRGRHLRHGRRLVVRHDAGRRDRDPADRRRQGLVHRRDRRQDARRQEGRLLSSVLWDFGARYDAGHHRHRGRAPSASQGYTLDVDNGGISLLQTDSTSPPTSGPRSRRPTPGHRGRQHPGPADADAGRRRGAHRQGQLAMTSAPRGCGSEPGSRARAETAPGRRRRRLDRGDIASPRSSSPASPRPSPASSPTTASTSRAMPGEVLCLLGENGAGKSTLMSILVRALPAGRGHASASAGRTCASTPRSDAVDLGIGMVHQHISLIPTLTVLENLMLGQSEGVRPATRRPRGRGSRELVEHARRRGRRRRARRARWRSASSSRSRSSRRSGRARRCSSSTSPPRCSRPQGIDDLQKVLVRAQGAGPRDHLHHAQAPRGDRDRRPRLGAQAGPGRRARSSPDDARLTAAGAAAARSSRLMFGERGGRGLPTSPSCARTFEPAVAAARTIVRRAAPGARPASRSPAKRGQHGIDGRDASRCAPARSSASPAWTATASGRWPRPSPASARRPRGDIRLAGKSIAQLSVSAPPASRPALRHRRPARRGHRRPAHRGHQPGPQAHRRRAVLAARRASTGPPSTPPRGS